MTLVVTHAQGFLGCFTTEPDGTLKQRALIDTGQPDPTPLDLATLGERMAKEYNWVNGNSVSDGGKPKALPSKKQPKEIPAPRKIRFKGKGQSPDGMVPSEREAFILEYLATNGESALSQITRAKGLEPSEANGRWHHSMNALQNRGLVVGRLYLHPGGKRNMWKLA